MKNYNCESSYVICLIHFSVTVSCEDKLATDESNEQQGSFLPRCSQRSKKAIKRKDLRNGTIILIIYSVELQYQKMNIQITYQGYIFDFHSSIKQSTIFDLVEKLGFTIKDVLAYLALDQVPNLFNLTRLIIVDSIGY